MRVVRAVLISLLLHFLLSGGLVLLASKVYKPAPQSVEVTLVPERQILEALTPKKKQVVRQTIVPEKLKAPDDETLAKFLSEKKQRVREETQAAKSGMTANRSNLTLAGQDKKTKTDNIKERLNKDGYQSVDISRGLQEMNQFEQGTSTIGESMPKEMKVGSFTALNTDRYLFYTFYARMEELIRYRWESKVQQAIHHFDSRTLIQASDRNWVTQVEFLLDKNGILRQALVMKESGILPFDSAAINAFKEAKVFPNPPAEMVEDDGYIHIKFSFTVNYLPPAMVNRN
ncbi:MAG: energy transducer TonB family protein [Bdellovibrio sp.]